MSLQYWKLPGSEILNGTQQIAVRFNGTAADGQTVGAHAAVRQAERVKYSILYLCVCVVCVCVCVCVCVFGCEAWPDAVGDMLSGE